jgi:hypothetical protein
MAILDHIGLNRYVYMTASADTMTLGSHTVSDISNSSGNSILGSSLDDSRLLLGINLYNNGPYGHSSWQQIRVSENPLSRHMRANNQFSIVRPGKERISFVNGKRTVVPERHGSTELLDEPAIVSAYKPFFIVGTVDGYDAFGRPKEKTFRKRSSLNNNTAYFTNDLINDIANVKERSDQAYDSLKGYYLENTLEDETSPLNSFEKLVFRQNIYPPQKYTYKSYTRARTNFSFNWRDTLANRQVTNINNNFSLVTGSCNGLISSSIWPLDVDPDWQDFPLPLIQHLGLSYYNGSTAVQITSSFGILWNHYSQFAYDLSTTTSLLCGKRSVDNAKLAPGPIYARRHTLYLKESVVAPTGQTTLKASSDMSTDTIFGGEAYWDVGEQAGKDPFFDTYEDYSEDIKRKGKNYSIIPEYKMSNHVESLLSSSALIAPDNIFSIEGGKTGHSDSTTKEFYEIYSNSDFLKNFDIVLDDHKDFTEPSGISITCKAIKKFVPYNGFYPAQRSVNLAEQFYSSYRDYTKILSGISTTFDFGFQNILGPLFGPGVLFNSIKSGIACDYPIITGSLGVGKTTVSPPGESSYFADYRISNNTFDLRIPFEAIVEPEKYLANEILTCNEIHPSGNVSGSAYWDGNGDRLYTRMANNFLAEVPIFFLKNEKFSTIASLPQRDPNFGQVDNTTEAYSMRVKIYRSMDTPNTFVENRTSSPVKYQPPQDIIQGQKETMTMYSRPSAFGPPSLGNASKAGGSTWNTPDTNTITQSAGIIYSESSNGINYPFTPPYYHGTSWVDIVFKPSQKKKYTIDEIIASSSVTYHRFDHTPYTYEATSIVASGPQAITSINDNAMQISASLNIFAKGFLGETPMELLNVQVDDQTRARWIIQPKFETPILNFKDYVDAGGHTSNVTLPNNASSASVPVGMWHQYGRIPTENEGIYMQVTDIPSQWMRGYHNRAVSDIAKSGSLADLCGFSTEPVKLGKPANSKKISECVVAAPFIEDEGVKKFFNINKKMVSRILKGETEVTDETIVDMVEKMKRFIFPPSMDFVNFPKLVEPFAMYVFEFSSKLSQKDLTDIWQNIKPGIGNSHEEQTVTISHSLINDKMRMLSKKKLRSDIRWMVFKVKQRASANYYDQVFAKKGDKTNFVDAALDLTSTGPEDKIQYNWPYDFFSLVELVKIDASIKLSDVEEDDQGETVDKPKRATEASRNVDFTNLFPKSK